MCNDDTIIVDLSGYRHQRSRFVFGIVTRWTILYYYFVVIIIVYIINDLTVIFIISSHSDQTRSHIIIRCFEFHTRNWKSQNNSSNNNTLRYYSFSRTVSIIFYVLLLMFLLWLSYRFLMTIIMLSSNVPLCSKKLKTKKKTTAGWLNKT